MKKYLIITILLILSSLTKLQSQEKVVVPGITEGYLVAGKIIDGDTVPHIKLRQITILPPFKFTNNRQRRRYSRLVRYVKKVYPYSQIVKDKLYEINAHVDSVDSRREKKKYINKKEKELKEEFEGELRKLTFSQGRILIKLINRETGETTYAIVKDLKGSLSAFFWQSVAVIFNSSLKYEYDAEGEDAMIEDIVVRIENGQL